VIRWIKRLWWRFKYRNAPVKWGFYDKVLLQKLLDQCAFEQFGRIPDLKPNTGRTVKFRRYSQLEECTDGDSGKPAAE
jgi:hypothetical protein